MKPPQDFAIDVCADFWAAHMTRTCVQGGISVILLVVICRIGPHMPASARSGLWWLACPIALTLTLLPASAPPHSVSEPILIELSVKHWNDASRSQHAYEVIGVLFE